jgi:predicted amidohydrolase
MYTGASAQRLGCPGDHVCAIDALVREAAGRGAKLIVAPEYALPQINAEPEVAVGLRPSSPVQSPLQTRFSALASELGIYLVIDLETVVQSRHYNTQVALAPTGKVVARHHKFELFEGERIGLAAGTDTATFDTPFGRVGLLICADIYGDPERHEALVRDGGVDIIAFSAAWTAPGARRWPAAFAHDWGVYVVAANSATGLGQGGGIFDHSGVRLTPTMTEGGPIAIAAIGGAPVSGSAGSHGRP